MNAPGDGIFMSAGCRELSPETFDKPCFESTGVLCCEEVIALPFCSPGVTFRMNCRDSKLLGGWFTATRDQTVKIKFDTWIRSQREPRGGGGLWFWWVVTRKVPWVCVGIPHSKWTWTYSLVHQIL